MMVCVPAEPGKAWREHEGVIVATPVACRMLPITPHRAGFPFPFLAPGKDSNFEPPLPR